MAREVGFEEIGAVMTKQGPVTIVRSTGSLQKPAIVPAIAGTRTGLASTKTALPLGVGQFVPAGALVLVLQANAQGFMRSRRLVITTPRADAVPGVAPLVAGLQVTVAGITFGAQNILIGIGAMPVEAFAPDAVDNDVVAGIPVSPGLLVTVNLAINLAPGAGGLVNVGATLFGDSV